MATLLSLCSVIRDRHAQCGHYGGLGLISRFAAAENTLRVQLSGLERPT
jgi:hypothetical protein